MCARVCVCLRACSVCVLWRAYVCMCCVVRACVCVVQYVLHIIAHVATGNG